MLFKQKYLNLNLGLVKENFVVTRKEDIKQWEARGFKKIRKYPLFNINPDFSETVMLGVPLNIEQFGTDNFKKSRIIDISFRCGTYGMGGPGFFGLKIQGDFGIRWLTYCIWSAGNHVLYDDNIMKCYPKYEQRYKPLIMSRKYLNDLEQLKELLSDMTIKEILVSKDNFEIVLVDSAQKIHSVSSYKYSDKFPEQGGTGKKRNSFERGEMKEYLLVTFDETYLVV